jgi:uncharacterized damage-inducible protein DinB
MSDPAKDVLVAMLQRQRESLIGKLDGLSEYDARRPVVPTGTNLLGLIKHVASVQLEYVTVVFGRRQGRELPWFGEDAEPDADMWAAADESRAAIVELYTFSCAQADATAAALSLDAEGEVPWWPPERRVVTLQQILVHLIGEVARHAGHADVARELIDGSAGSRPDDPNLPQRTAAEWAEYRARIEAAARDADPSTG